MAIQMRSLAVGVSVCGQLEVADVAEAARLGFAALVNNRPDGEDAGQPLSADLARAAANAGLAYVHIPVSGFVTPAHVAAMQEALATLPRPLLAFCRSGARSERLWSLAAHEAT